MSQKFDNLPGALRADRAAAKSARRVHRFRADVLRAWAATSPCGPFAKPSAPSSAQGDASDTWIFTAIFAIAHRAVLRMPGRARAPRNAGARHLRHSWPWLSPSQRVVFETDPQNMVLARIFYVGISVINLFLVSVFWSFLLEIFQSEQTKRLFGFIAAGGTAGALVGPVHRPTARQLTSAISGVLFFGAGMFVDRHLPAARAARQMAPASVAAAGAPAATQSDRDRALSVAIPSRASPRDTQSPISSASRCSSS